MIGFLLFALCSLAFTIGLSFLVFVLSSVFHLSVFAGTNFSWLAVHCLLIGMAGSLVSLLMSRVIARISMNVDLIDEPQNDAELFLMREVRDLAQRSGVAMPQVGVFYSSQINAFATGPSKNRSLIAVSSALLEGMEADEARAVLAHEMGHVRSGDMVWMCIINGVASSLVLFFSSILSSAFMAAGNQKRGDSGYEALRFVIEMILQFVLGLVSTVFVMAFSRYREYRADAQAAHLVGKRHMVRALMRLDSVNRYNEESMPPSMKAFGVFGKAGLFSSHPSIDERIQALESGKYA
jgi:heat shock protein HtpX